MVAALVALKFASVLGLRSLIGFLDAHARMPARVCRDLAPSHRWRSSTGAIAGARLILCLKCLPPTMRTSNFIISLFVAQPITPRATLGPLAAIEAL
jgi:hypothetical protein